MIDPHIYMLAVGIGNIAFAVLMAAYVRGAGATQGLPLWMWARVAFGAAQMVAWLRPTTGLPLLAILEAVFWIAGLTLEGRVFAIFFGFLRLRRYLIPLAALGVLLACIGFLNGLPTEQLSLYAFLTLGLGSLVIGVLLMQPRLAGATTLQRVIAANDIGVGVILAGGAGAALLGAPPTPPMQALMYCAGYLLLIVHGFGFILMSKQRDDARMERLATTDDLTGLLNRRAFFARADAARLLSLRVHQPITLLMLDIDHFKQLNDRFGHATGDEALVKFSATCSATLRGHDMLGRLGGEEFALILPGTNLAGALHAAERLRQGVIDTPLLAGGNNYTMTVSIGVVVIEPGEDLTKALARADDALYEAKRNGRNRVEVGAPARRCA